MLEINNRIYIVLEDKWRAIDNFSLLFCNFIANKYIIITI